MLNMTESKRLLKEAENCLISAQKNIEIDEFRVSVQQSQLCIELSCKAVIAKFEEPKWTHAPGEQLNLVVKRIKNSEDKPTLESLMKLAENADKVEDWHGWSVYGKEENDKWLSANELCTKEVARKLLEIAKTSYEIAHSYII